MAPKTRFSVKRQPSTGIVMAKRSCDVGSGADKNSELSELKNEQPKLKLYNFNIEQQHNLSAFHSVTFSKKDVAGIGLRSTEKELATFVEPFFHSPNLHLWKQLNQDAQTQGFRNFPLFLERNPVLARAVIIKKFTLASLTKQTDKEEQAADKKVSGAGLGIQTPVRCPLESMPQKIQHPANAAVDQRSRYLMPKFPQTWRLVLPHTRKGRVLKTLSLEKFLGCQLPLSTS